MEVILFDDNRESGHSIVFFLRRGSRKLKACLGGAIRQKLTKAYKGEEVKIVSILSAHTFWITPIHNQVYQHFVLPLEKNIMLGSDIIMPNYSMTMTSQRFKVVVKM